MRPSTIVTPVLFALFLLIVLVWLVSQRDPTDFIAGQTHFAIIRQAVGLFIAGAAGLLLLIRALAGEPPARLLALVLPALAGALLIEPSWGVALGLAGASAAIALRPAFGYSRRLPPVPPPHHPQAL